jgi:hypothetical protein
MTICYNRHIPVGAVTIPRSDFSAHLQIIQVFV